MSFWKEIFQPRKKEEINIESFNLTAGAISIFWEKKTKSIRYTETKTTSVCIYWITFLARSSSADALAVTKMLFLTK